MEWRGPGKGCVYALKYKPTFSGGFFILLTGKDIRKCLPKMLEYSLNAMLYLSD